MARRPRYGIVDRLNFFGVLYRHIRRDLPLPALRRRVLFGRGIVYA
jgi:hypothetical protein